MLGTKLGSSRRAAGAKFLALSVCLQMPVSLSINKIALLGIVILTGRCTILHCPGYRVCVQLSDVIILMVCSLSLRALQTVLHCSVLTLMHVLLLNPEGVVVPSVPCALHCQS